MSERSEGVRVPPHEWRWFGSPGHFICAHMCRFHLCTQVGDYLVSTVGELWPSRSSREIHARVYDSPWLAENIHRKGDDFDHAYMQRFGFEEVGHARKYETMVFAAGEPCASESCGCGLPTISGQELDFAGYNERKDADAGHLALCQKWAATPPDSEPS